MWPSSTMWVGHPLKCHHQGCLAYPIFSNFGLCAECWTHFMCHHELWPISESHPLSYINNSLGYQKITDPIFTFFLFLVVFLTFCSSLSSLAVWPYFLHGQKKIWLNYTFWLKIMKNRCLKSQNFHNKWGLNSAIFKQQGAKFYCVLKKWGLYLGAYLLASYMGCPRTRANHISLFSFGWVVIAVCCPISVRELIKSFRNIVKWFKVAISNEQSIN